MTWKYDLTDDRQSMDVIDHTGAVVATVQNDGGGLDVKQEVLDVMYDAAVAAYEDAGGSVDGYALNVLADAAFEQIEEAP